MRIKIRKISQRIGEDRRSGWAAALADRGLPVDLVAEVDDEVSAAERAAAVLVDQHAPEGFVCASDTLALGVLRALHARGLEAGRDVAVTGFDDSPTSALVTPALTSVRQPLEEVARALVARLHARLAEPTGPADGLLLTPALVLRSSG